MNPKREEAGAEGSSGAAAAPKEPAQPAPAAPEAPPAGQPTAPEGFVPAEQLRAVAKERDDLKKQQDEAETKRAEEQGEWQKLAEKREGEAKAWQDRFVSTARRAAFVAAAATGKVRAADPDAAYKLALADGLLNDVKVDDEGNADATAIAAAVKTTIDTYEFLKPGSGSFGGERGNAQPESNGVDESKLTSRERMERAIAADMQKRGTLRS